MGAFTGIICTSEGVELESDKESRLAMGKTHWTEKAIGDMNDLVVVKDISNAGNHNCYVTTLEGVRIPVSHGVLCVCENTERALNAASLEVLDHQLERAHRAILHPQRTPGTVVQIGFSPEEVAQIRKTVAAFERKDKDQLLYLSRFAGDSNLDTFQLELDARMRQNVLTNEQRRAIGELMGFMAAIELTPRRLSKAMEYVAMLV